MGSLEEGVAKMRGRVVGHMNADHPGSLLAYARYYAGMADAASATMTDCTAKGFELDVVKKDGSVVKKVLIPFDPPLERAADLRKVSVAMHFTAYNGLGLRYKLESGFYADAARQALSHVPPRAKAGLLAAAVACGAAVAYALLSRRGARAA